MLLVSSDYQSDQLEIHDSCPHCLDRLTLTIDDSAIKEATPKPMYAFYGGG